MIVHALCAAAHFSMFAVAVSKTGDERTDGFDFVYADVRVRESMLVPFNCVFECHNGTANTSKCEQNGGAATVVTDYCNGTVKVRDDVDFLSGTRIDAETASPSAACVESGAFLSSSAADGAGEGADATTAYRSGWSRRAESFELAQLPTARRLPLYLIIAIEAVTFLSHIATTAFYAPIWHTSRQGSDNHQWWESLDDANALPIRWFEYAVSATLMQLFVASIANVIVIETIIAQVCATFSLMLIGQVIEVTPFLVRKLAYIYFAGVPLFLAGWLPVMLAVNGGLRRFACPGEDGYGLSCAEPSCFGSTFVGQIRAYTFALMLIFIVFPMVELFFATYCCVPVEALNSITTTRDRVARLCRSFFFGWGPPLFVLSTFLIFLAEADRTGSAGAVALAVVGGVTAAVGLLVLLYCWVVDELCLRPSRTTLPWRSLSRQAELWLEHHRHSSSPCGQRYTSCWSSATRVPYALETIANEKLGPAGSSISTSSFSLDAVYDPSMAQVLAKSIVHALVSLLAKTVLFAFFLQVYHFRDW